MLALVASSMWSQFHALPGIFQKRHTTDVSPFEVLAQPARRSILDHLRGGEFLVGDLAGAVGLTQPATSKHLRVLRDAGLVTARVDGPRRWYGLRAEPLAEIDDWLAPYRWMWESRLDRLGAHLDAMDPDEGDADVR
jgi:DNA-binding transcriptional ArsR family regulator